MESADMPETRRKLTTIFSADVQDYTRLMGADEEGTLRTLKRYRDAMTALIGAHGGRVINTWGDGLIAEFPSVVEAVRAAVDTQNELAGYNAGTPGERQMLFRIGINLGDVIEVGDDIYGDGVNIAARLQASAPPGGIVISNTVYDQVRNKVTVGFDFLGPLQVKNVSEAVPSYVIRIGGAETASAGAAPSATGRRREHPSSALDSAGLFLPAGNPGLYAAYALAAAALVVINLLTWGGSFWARWPLLALAYVAALQWSRSQRILDARLAGLILTAIALVTINLMTWSGNFWAQWPLLAFAILIAMRLLRLRR